MSTEAYSEGFSNFLTQHYVSESEKSQRRSVGFLTRTRLPREIRKIIKKKDGIFYSEEVFNTLPGWKVAEDSVFTGCAWDLSCHGLMTGKGITVEALSNGSIIVRGAPNATTLILLEEWRSNNIVLLKALQKAVSNPMTIVF